MTAFTGLVTATLFIFNPDVRGLTAGGTISTTFSWTWTVLYFTGSLGILWGLIRLDDRLEIAGLSLFSVAAVVNGIAILQVRGFDSGGAYVGLQYLGLFVASIIRIRNIFVLRKKMHPSKL